MFGELLSPIFGIATICLAAWGVGRPLAFGLCKSHDDWLSAAVWSSSTGLIAYGLLYAGLGLLGKLSIPLIGACTFAGALLAVFCLVRRAPLTKSILAASDSRPNAANLAGVTAPNSAAENPPEKWLFHGQFILAGLVLVSSFISALAPSTAGDALCYHLQLPKRFLSDQAIVFDIYDENSTFPLLTEVWYAWALALDGPRTAQLMHWGLGVLLSMASVLLARPIVGKRWSWMVGVVVLCIPGINNQMTVPLNDTALACFATLALVAWNNAVRGAGQAHWFVVTGVMLGAALGIKYVALILCAAAVCGVALDSWRQNGLQRHIVKGALAAAVVAVSISGVWYLRAFWHRGNPVYPFFQELVDDGARTSLPKSKAKLGRSAVNLASAPWNLTMYPNEYGGRGHQAGPIFLALLPGLLLVRKSRELRFLLFTAACYGGMWFFLRQNLRFLFPIFPLLSVGGVTVVCQVLRDTSRLSRISQLGFAAMLVGCALIPAVRARAHVRVALGIESADEYLTRHEPTYLAASWMNVKLPSDAKILSQESRSYYFQHRTVRESTYRRQTRYLKRFDRGLDTLEQLKAEGFTHLLLVESLGGVHYNGKLNEVVARAEVEAQQESLSENPMAASAENSANLASHPASQVRPVLLEQWLHTDSSGNSRVYRLVELREVSAAPESSLETAVRPSSGSKQR